MRRGATWHGRAAATLLLAGSAAFASASCGSGAPARVTTATPVIVDTDMASDDIMALSYLLTVPGIAVRAVTVEGTGEAHGPAGARNVLRLIRSLGIRRTIPVGYGPPNPLSGFRSFPPDWRAAADHMYNLNLPAWRGPEPAASAERLLADTILDSARPVEVITLGPLTNIALALHAHPELASKIARIYAMAGAVRVDGNETIHQQAEWNVYIDATAASQVMKSGVPMTLIPLDASDSVPITPFVREAIQAHARTPALRVVGTLLSDAYYAQPFVYFWDPLAAVASRDSGVVRLADTRLVIDTSEGPSHGVTRAGPTGASVLAATSADAAAFEHQFLAGLNGGRPVPIPPVPAVRQLMVTFDGSTFSYQGPHAAAAGQLQVQLANRSQVPFDGFELAIGKLAASRTLADVQQVINQGTATSVPSWFQVAALLPASSGAEPIWGVSLTAGRYALVCVHQRDGTMSALTELVIR
jgi:inosine-uridine nucleoside N-ribohydrolase